MSSPLLPGRRRTFAGRGAAAAACTVLATACVLAAGCGSTAAPGPGSGPAAIAKVSLDVTFAAAPGTASRHYTLSCEPAGGSTPDPAAACRKLLATASFFGPEPAHVACPMIMSSAARATVSGTYLGKTVHETIVDGGCDLGRYQLLKQIYN